MQVPIDIETIPDQSPNAIDRYVDFENIKPPSDLSKLKACEELGIVGDDAKYTSKADALAMWCDKFGKEAALKVAEEKWLKTSFDGLYGEVFCISWAIDGEIFNVKRDSIVGGDKELILKFIDKLQGQMAGAKHLNTPFFIGHNVIFDLKFLFRRCVVNNISSPFAFPFHGRHDSDYFCTSKAWCEFKEYISLDNLCRGLGIKHKEGIDGSQVWQYVKDGRYEEVAQYCNDDVYRVIELFKRLK